MSIADLLDLHKRERQPGLHPHAPGEGNGEVVAILGSGGKTSLLWLLAERFRDERVLVSTTVKLWPPSRERYDFFPDASLLTQNGPGIWERGGVPRGITFAGIPLTEQEKIGGLPPDVLEAQFPLFDKSFVEADGSRGLPYKGWADHEPVVPEAATLTIAVIPVPPPDLLVSEATAHRLSLFCEISGARPGQPLSPRHLASLIAHPRGLLARTRGRVALFFNQAESDEGVALARYTLSLLPGDCRRGIWRAVAGSARLDEGQVL